jgi:hypothetical protein
MDDRTAYSILKIRPGTSIEKISKRHDHFIVLYKRHLMGDRFNISTEEIEQMKLAYEHFLYKEISDKELEDLYPVESKSLGHQVWRSSAKIAAPFVKRHRAKIIYTIFMCFLTFLIITIKNYQPVDLRIAVFGPEPKTDADYEKLNSGIQSFRAEILENNKTVKRPMIYYYPVTDISSALMAYYSAENDDVLIIEKSLKEEMESLGIKFLAIDSQTLQDTSQAFGLINQETGLITDVAISKETSLYQNLCNQQGSNKIWVSALSQNVRNTDHAIRLIEFYSLYSEALR